jgi:stage V sporulation protein K
MDKLLKSNVGLASRFPVRLHFPDYSVDELMLMVDTWFAEHRYVTGKKVMQRIRDIIAQAAEDKAFGAGRFVHTLIQNTILPKMAMRLFSRSSGPKVDVDILTKVLPEDVPAPQEVLKRIQGPKQKVRSIGFR